MMLKKSFKSIGAGAGRDRLSRMTGDQGYSGQAVDPFKLFKMFVKGKAAFQFKRSHDGETCTVSKTKILVGVSFENGEGEVLMRRSYGDHFNKTTLLQVLPEKNGDTM